MSSKEYLKAIKAYLVKKYEDHIFSVILFGSLLDSPSGDSRSTDIDLLIILKDSCPKSAFNSIKKEILTLEQYYISSNKGFFDFFIKGIQRATGMFVNTFLCYYTPFNMKDFSEVFGVNSIVAYLLAPQNSVWMSLAQRHRVLWGNDVFSNWHTTSNLQKSDLIRSFLMNVLLSLGTLCLSTITKSLTHFAMESVKWSLFTWGNWLRLPSAPIDSLAQTYGIQASQSDKQLLKSFFQYRKSKTPDTYLVLYAPFFIVKLHKNLITIKA